MIPYQLRTCIPGPVHSDEEEEEAGIVLIVEDASLVMIQKPFSSFFLSLPNVPFHVLCVFIVYSSCVPYVIVIYCPLLTKHTAIHCPSHHADTEAGLVSGSGRKYYCCKCSAVPAPVQLSPQCQDSLASTTSRHSRLS